MKLKCLGSSSKGNNYLLIGKKEILIIEAGISIKKILKGISFKLQKVGGCLISHQHL